MTRFRPPPLPRLSKSRVPRSLDPAGKMQEALAAGDVDAMRLLLLAQAQPVAESPAASHPLRQPDMLTARANSLANSLLSRGLTTLERAEAASASRAPEQQHTQRTVRLPDLGLEILDSPVMGQTIWPAALALCRWLKDHPTRVRGAHVRASRLSPAGEPPSHPLTSRVSHIARALTARVAARRSSSLAPGRGLRGSSRSRSARPRSRSPMPTRRSYRSCAPT